ncbi:CatB-related O-acetyltransferase [Levilactobacillus cerevisiae]|uniref:CatB-related O-acetyltransferase n=1 Tax=Levilactobacillus cerevisiae TaxID=1704076 RepID=UPI0013DE0F4E|nr:CatB-related O-acetyltransferase [Levilactobacillus cerevisiae]
MTEISGVAFFQKGVVQRHNRNRQRILYTKPVNTLFRERRVYTNIHSQQSRFKIDQDQIYFGNQAVIEPYTAFGRGTAFHTMGAFSYSWSILPVNTVVGRYSSIAAECRVMNVNHALHHFTTSSLTFDHDHQPFNDYLADHPELQFNTVGQDGMYQIQPVVIGNDVWIGRGCVFGNKGIVVNDGAVVAAGSLVTHDVPPYAVVGGWPAKVIKFRFDFATIHTLMNLKWWQYDFGQFSTVEVQEDIDDFIKKVRTLRSSDCLTPYNPAPLTLQDIQAVTH